MTNHALRQAGFVPVSILLNFILAVVLLGVAGFAIWAFINYQDYKTDVDGRVAQAVTVAREEQRQEDEAAFAEAEKRPTRTLTSPAELGSVTISYPKTWSVYIADDGSTRQYEAYLQPGAVHSLQSRRPYALRVSIVDSPYEKTVSTYDQRVTDGSLKTKSVKLNNETGVRLDGRFSDTTEGAMVIFKVRDKSLLVFTESNAFLKDFNDIILPSLKFNR